MWLFGYSASAYILVLLLIFGVHGLISFFIRRKQDETDVNWTPAEAVSVTVTIFFLTQIVVALIAGAIGQANGLNEDQVTSVLDSSPGWQFLMVLSIELLTAGLIYIFVVKRRQTSLKAIGVVAPKLRDVAYALAGFGVYLVVYGLLLFKIVEKYFPQIDTGQKQELGFSTSIGGPELLFVFMSLVILPPLVEELLVRGFLYTGLRTKLPKIAAALGASLIFALAHLQWGSGNPLLWTAAIDTFVLSMVLIWLRQKTGSLWPGIGVHFIKNGIAFVALFILKVS